MSTNRTITICGLLLATFALAPSLTAQLGHKKDYVYAGPRVLAVESQGCITEDASCNVGIGVESPSARLHVESTAGDPGNDALVKDTAGNAILRVETTAASKHALLAVTNPYNSWYFSTNHSVLVIQDQSFDAELELTSGGDLTIKGDLTVNGVITELGLDRVFQPDYPLLSIEEHSAAMFGNSYLPAVGPTPDESPGPIQVGDKMVRILNELEVAHIYIDQLNKRLKTAEGRAAALDQYRAAGRWVNASSRELKQNIVEVGAEQAIETVLALSPVRFAYKEEPSEEHLGFIAEDVPELVATPNRKTLSAMDVVAVLTRTVQEQQRHLEEKDTQLQSLEQRMARLEGLLQADAGASPPSQGTNKAAD